MIKSFLYVVFCFLKRSKIHIIIPLLILSIVSCADNIDDTIITENKYADGGDADNDLPTVSFAASTSYTYEYETNAHAINIVLSESSEDTITVTVTDLQTGTADQITDYTLTGWSSPAVLTFEPGETLRSIYITPVQDTAYEGAGETIILEISSPTNAKLGTSSHQVIINEDDSSWIKLGDAPIQRAGAAVTLQDDWLYIYGGEDYSGVNGDFWRYNLSDSTYESLDDDPGARAYATLSNLNGTLYLFGGIDENGKLYDDKTDGMYYYTTIAVLPGWSSILGANTTGTFPKGRACHIAVPDNSTNTLYFHGGQDASLKTLNDDTLYELNLNTKAWTTPAITISLIRSEHAALYYDDNIYFFGGYNDSGTYTNGLYKYGPLNVGPSFSTVAVSTNTTAASFISARGGISMIEHNGNFYVFGGTSGTSCLNDLWVFSGGKWTKLSTAPFSRCFYSAVKYKDSLIIYGGYYLNSSSQPVYSNEIWQYKLD